MISKKLEREMFQIWGLLQAASYPLVKDSSNHSYWHLMENITERYAKVMDEFFGVEE